MKLIQNLPIKYKAYVLVGIGVVTAVLLLVVTNIGLSSIKSKLDELVLSTNVERFAYLTILEEKNYLLNSNASITNNQLANNAFERAKKDVETINDTLDKIDATTSNKGLLEKSTNARSGTNEYKELYYKGVELLVNIGKETTNLERDGDIATLQAQEYVLEKRKQLDEKLDSILVKKTNIATDIWKLTYVIRADEKRYMLNPDAKTFERMKENFAQMLASLDMLKNLASDAQERQKISVFYDAAKSYETAAYKWVELNQNLMTIVLPKMKLLGDTVVKQAMEAAEEAQANMIKTRNEIVITLLSIAGIAIILGALLGSIIAKIIVQQINQVCNSISAIANGDLSSSIESNSTDELGMMLKSTKVMQDNLSKLVQEIQSITNNAIRGDFSKKMVLSDKKGFGQEIGKSLNQLSDIVDTGMHDVMRVANALANGDLSQKITNEYLGVFGQTQNSVNQTVDALNELVEEIEKIVYSGADCGDFSVKMTVHDKVGYGKRLAELINRLFGTTEKSLNDVLRIAESLAGGDLTQHIQDDYVGAFAAVKIGMNKTVENLKSLIGEIKATSQIIASASQEISAGNHDLSHRTEEQAASLEETATSMEQLATTVQTNTGNAKHANDLAVGASNTAQKGVEVVNNVVATMASINEASHRIVDIVSVIDDIAFQTNILALNAAVEAARAGEQGKGFAVVAVEVRNLAQRAANAAGEVKYLIGESVERINGGSKQVAQAGKTMEDIVGAIQEVSFIVSGIATASIEQNAGIEQVHEAVVQMDGMTQQNAALVEEAAAAAQALSHQTRNLANEMAHFRTERN